MLDLPLNSAQIAAVPERIFVEVALPLRVYNTYTYEVPADVSAPLSPGVRVSVPFGRTRLITGYIVAVGVRPDEASLSRMKIIGEILDVEPLVDPSVLQLTKWVADYYASPWGEVIKAALPANINETYDKFICITALGSNNLESRNDEAVKSAGRRILELLSTTPEVNYKSVVSEIGGSLPWSVISKLEKQGLLTVHHRVKAGLVRAKKRKAVRLLSQNENGSSDDTLNETQRRIISLLGSHGGELTFTSLLEMAQCSASPLNTLARKGRIEIRVVDVRRDPLQNATIPESQDFELTPEQAAAKAQISQAISANAYSAFLLHGVTGSGKTEVYLRAMSEAVNAGKSALMLVPEIALTPVFARRLRSVFGDRVAIIHSSLSAGERFDEWTRIKREEATVVIGTRSAVFSPVSNLGIVVVDEEHDASYRQQESPFYNARDTAIMRAHMESAVVVLGSATPSLETFHNAKNGKYQYLRLPARINDRPMARAEIIDMRVQAAASNKPEILSADLLKALEETHSKGEQSIILLNRRGYSSFLLCRSCGESVQCINCDVTMTFHREEGRLICHYCNYSVPTPPGCPSCDGKYIYFVGAGTEQLEEKLKARFPHLRIARIDRDTASRHKSFESTLLRFSAGEIDMLVGTQMLAKGHDFHNVTLVGVVSVDAGLALPDFRSAERTFQLIMQVAGRAGRGDLEGRVLVQTYHPDHYALIFACAQDFEGFYDEEIKHRRNLNYPPFVSLAAFLIQDESLGNAQHMALELREILDAANSNHACRVLGPAPAPLSRLRGRHRIQILIKSASRQQLRTIVDDAITEANRRKLDLRHVNVEIDPVNLL